MKKVISVILTICIASAAFAIAVNAKTVVNVVSMRGTVIRESTVYAGEVFVDGVCAMKYLYSDDITSGSTCLAALRTALNSADHTGFGELVTSELVNEGSYGIAVCNIDSRTAEMSGSWTDAANVAALYYPALNVLDSSIVDLFGYDNGYTAFCSTGFFDEDLDELIDEYGYDYEIKGPLGTLSTTNSDSVTYNVEGGEVVKHIDRTVDYTLESVTVIYTCVTLGTPVPQIPSFSVVSLTLENSLKANFSVKKDLLNAFTEPYAVFEMNGKTVTVSDHTEKTVNNEDYFIFSFCGISPDMMNDNINATLHAKYNGVDYAGADLDYSISQYCYDALAATTDADGELRALLVDLLNYGAASQVYTDHNANDLVNAALTAEQASWGTSGDPVLVSVKNPDFTSEKYPQVISPSVLWKSASLILNDSVTMKFSFMADDITDVVIKIDNANGVTVKEIPANGLTESGNIYSFRYDDLNAAQMSEAVYVTAYRNNAAVSRTVVYSIESYACAKQNDADAKLASLVKEMMKYGNSAYAYAH